MKNKKINCVRIITAIVLALLSAISALPIAEATSSQSNDDLRLYDMICSARADNGLDGIALDSELSYVARVKCLDMIENGYFDHVSPTYGSIGEMLRGFGIDAYCSENIARYATVEKAHAALMTSLSHRRNILSVGFDRVGVAVGHYPDGSAAVVEIFAKTR